MERFVKVPSRTWRQVLDMLEVGDLHWMQRYSTGPHDRSPARELLDKLHRMSLYYPKAKVSK